jgi:hypothetical protein
MKTSGISPDLFGASGVITARIIAQPMMRETHDRVTANAETHFSYRYALATLGAMRFQHGILWPN